MRYKINVCIIYAYSITCILYIDHNKFKKYKFKQFIFQDYGIDVLTTNYVYFCLQTS